MYSYKSEATKFLNEYLEQNPQEVENRIQGRKRLWDVELDDKEQQGFKLAQIARGAYFYQND